MRPSGGHSATHAQDEFPGSVAPVPLTADEFTVGGGSRGGLSAPPTPGYASGSASGGRRGSASWGSSSSGPLAATPAGRGAASPGGPSSASRSTLPTSSEASKPRAFASLDDVFRTMTHAEVRGLLASSRAEAEAKSAALKEVVGDRYADLLGSVDEAAAMLRGIDAVVTHVRSIQEEAKTLLSAAGGAGAAAASPVAGAGSAAASPAAAAAASAWRVHGSEAVWRHLEAGRGWEAALAYAALCAPCGRAESGSGCTSAQLAATGPVLASRLDAALRAVLPSSWAALAGLTGVPMPVPERSPAPKSEEPLPDAGGAAAGPEAGPAAVTAAAAQDLVLTAAAVALLRVCAGDASVSSAATEPVAIPSAGAFVGHFLAALEGVVSEALLGALPALPGDAGAGLSAAALASLLYGGHVAATTTRALALLTATSSGSALALRLGLEAWVLTRLLPGAAAAPATAEAAAAALAGALLPPAAWRARGGLQAAAAAPGSSGLLLAPGAVNVAVTAGAAATDASLTRLPAYAAAASALAANPDLTPTAAAVRIRVTEAAKGWATQAVAALGSAAAAVAAAAAAAPGPAGAAGPAQPQSSVARAHSFIAWTRRACGWYDSAGQAQGVLPLASAATTLGLPAPAHASPAPAACYRLLFEGHMAALALSTARGTVKAAWTVGAPALLGRAADALGANAAVALTGRVGAATYAGPSAGRKPGAAAAGVSAGGVDVAALLQASALRAAALPSVAGALVPALRTAHLAAAAAGGSNGAASALLAAAAAQAEEVGAVEPTDESDLLAAVAAGAEDEDVNLLSVLEGAAAALRGLAPSKSAANAPASSTPPTSVITGLLALASALVGSLVSACAVPHAQTASSDASPQAVEAEWAAFVRPAAVAPLVAWLEDSVHRRAEAGVAAALAVAAPGPAGPLSVEDATEASATAVAGGFGCLLLGVAAEALGAAVGAVAPGNAELAARLHRCAATAAVAAGTALGGGYALPPVAAAASEAAQAGPSPPWRATHGAWLRYDVDEGGEGGVSVHVPLGVSAGTFSSVTRLARVAALLTPTHLEPGVPRRGAGAAAAGSASSSRSGPVRAVRLDAWGQPMVDQVLPSPAVTPEAASATSTTSATAAVECVAGLVHACLSTVAVRGTAVALSRGVAPRPGGVCTSLLLQTALDAWVLGHAAPLACPGSSLPGLIPYLIGTPAAGGGLAALPPSSAWGVAWQAGAGRRAAALLTAAPGTAPAVVVDVAEVVEAVLSKRLGADAAGAVARLVKGGADGAGPAGAPSTTPAELWRAIANEAADPVEWALAEGYLLSHGAEAVRTHALLWAGLARGPRMSGGSVTSSAAVGGVVVSASGPAGAGRAVDVLVSLDASGAAASRAAGATSGEPPAGWEAPLAEVLGAPGGSGAAARAFPAPLVAAMTHTGTGSSGGGSASALDAAAVAAAASLRTALLALPLVAAPALKLADMDTTTVPALPLVTGASVGEAGASTAAEALPRLPLLAVPSSGASSGASGSRGGATAAGAAGSSGLPRFASPAPALRWLGGDGAGVLFGGTAERGAGGFLGSAYPYDNDEEEDEEGEGSEDAEEAAAEEAAAEEQPEAAGEASAPTPAKPGFDDLRSPAKRAPAPRAPASAKQLLSPATPASAAFASPVAGRAARGVRRRAAPPPCSAVPSGELPYSVVSPLRSRARAGVAARAGPGSSAAAAAAAATPVSLMLASGGGHRSGSLLLGASPSMADAFSATGGAPGTGSKAGGPAAGSLLSALAGEAASLASAVGQWGRASGVGLFSALGEEEEGSGDESSGDEGAQAGGGSGAAAGGRGSGAGSVAAAVARVGGSAGGVFSRLFSGFGQGR